MENFQPGEYFKVILGNDGKKFFKKLNHLEILRDSKRIAKEKRRDAATQLNQST